MNEDHTVNGDRLYTRQFFQVFLAVLLFMTGVAMQFHFGQYVSYLGHGVDVLGRLLGGSMVGVLAIRLHLGHWIDRFGCRPTWCVGTLVMAASVGAMQFARPLWLVVTLRTVSMMAMAAVMTTAAVFAAQLAPPRRRAESLGIMGLSGLLGIMVGPTIGDWIFAGAVDSITPYRVFFTASATCSLLAGAAMLTVKAAPQPSSTKVERSSATRTTIADSSPFRVIQRHWPGMILLVSAVFGMSFCLHFTFLERLAEQRGFRNIKVFFLVYGFAAITLRIACRRVPERLGRGRTLLGGLLIDALGLLLLVGVRTEWQMVLPALLMGAGHCFVFPSMVDLGAGRLPIQHRGIGTSLILGAGDLGMLTGYFALGELIDRLGFDATLVILAATVLLTAGLLAYASRANASTCRAVT